MITLHPKEDQSDCAHQTVKSNNIERLTNLPPAADLAKHVQGAIQALLVEIRLKELHIFEPVPH
jgi:hypothetical protein